MRWPTTIGRLLAALAPVPRADLDVVVVCNGCSDDTASVAAAFEAAVEQVAASTQQLLDALVVRGSGARRAEVAAEVG